MHTINPSTLCVAIPALAFIISPTVSALADPAATTPASAQRTDKPAETPPDGSFLAGPRVEREKPEPTLVERSFDGTVKRLDTDPAELAVLRIELTDRSRQAVETILLERKAVLDKIVTDNLELLSRFQGFESAEPDERRELRAELSRITRPIRARGRLIDELEHALTADEYQQVRSMTREYWEALFAQETSDQQGPQRARSMIRFVSREAVRLAGQSIKASYERTIGQRSDDFEQLLTTLGLTPEQEGQIRKVVGDEFTATFGKSTPQDRARTFRKILGILDQDQKQILIERYLESRNDTDPEPRTQPRRSNPDTMMSPADAPDT